MSGKKLHVGEGFIFSRQIIDQQIIDRRGVFTTAVNEAITIQEVASFYDTEASAEAESFDVVGGRDQEKAKERK